MPLPHFNNINTRWVDYAMHIISSFYKNRDGEFKDELGYEFYKIIKGKHQSEFDKSSRNYFLLESLFFMEDATPYEFISDCTDEEWKRIQDFFEKRYNVKLRKEKLSNIN